MSNNLVEKIEFQVSIGNANKALSALRTYGLTPKVAENIISHESVTAIYDHGIIPKEALSPQLIELFGEQHICDAITYSYIFMDDYELDWDEYKLVLNTLLKVYRPEELIVNPDKIRFFLDAMSIALLLELSKKMEDIDNLNLLFKDHLFIEILTELDNEAIVEMSANPYEEDDNCHEEE